MLTNSPFLQAMKRLVKPASQDPIDDLPTLYDLYNEYDQKPWQVIVNRIDQMKIEQAQMNNRKIHITPGLSDAQLLKLHSKYFPDYAIQLVYHDLFDLYEIKKSGSTEFVFSYHSGIYEPIKEIY